MRISCLFGEMFIFCLLLNWVVAVESCDIQAFSDMVIRCVLGAFHGPVIRSVSVS